MPVPCPCQILAGSLLLALPCGHGLIPGPMAPYPTASCPTTPSPTAPCPMALCSPKEPPALPSQSLCFPSLEASGPEAQVSKVEKQFLPLQIAPVLFCFLTRLTQPWKPGLLPLGWLTGAVAALPGTQGHPSEYEPPVSSAQIFTWMGAGARCLSQGAACTPGLSKCKLAEHKATAQSSPPCQRVGGQHVSREQGQS